MSPNASTGKTALTPKQKSDTLKEIDKLTKQNLDFGEILRGINAKFKITPDGKEIEIYGKDRNNKNVLLQTLKGKVAEAEKEKIDIMRKKTKKIAIQNEHRLEELNDMIDGSYKANLSQWQSDEESTPTSNEYNYDPNKGLVRK